MKTQQKLVWGGARIELLALLPDIQSQIETGKTKSQIYQDLINCGKLTCKKSVFYSQLNKLLRADKHHVARQHGGLGDFQKNSKFAPSLHTPSSSLSSSAVMAGGDRGAGGGFKSFDPNKTLLSREKVEG